MTAPPTVPQPHYQHPPDGQPYDQPPAPRRSRRKWPWVVLGVVVLFIIIGVANSPSPPSSTTETLVPTPEQTAAQQPVAPPLVAQEQTVEAADRPAPQPVAPPPVVRQPVAPPPTARQPVAPPPTVQAADPPAPQRVAPQPVAPQPSNDSSSSAVYYKNCDAARAVGAAPINRGEPGYRSALDRNNDGVACE